MDLLQLQSDPAAFRDALAIDTDAGSQPFTECVDEWQRADFEALDSGWQRAVEGKSHDAQFQRAWLERPRGHSKSADLGIMAAWALFASRRRLSGIAAAGDQDQARLLRDAIGRLLHCNPWLSKLLQVQSYRVLNTRTESTLEIISSDAPTSYGLTPDFVIADEVTHWTKRDLWDSLISSAAKRSTCMFVVIANAGLQDDWQWQTREAVRTDPKWYFHRLEGPVASWIDADLLDEQQRLLPSIAYRRLWLNEWTTGSADWISEEDLNAAFLPELRPQSKAQSGYEYVAGADIGITRDATAICILGVRRGHQGHGRIRLTHTRIWKPTKGNRVDLQEVEDTLRVLHKAFDLRQLNYDPYEMRHMASLLQSGGIGRLGSGKVRKVRLPMVEVTQTPKNLQLMATTLIEAFSDHRVELYDDPDLRRDLQKLRIEERTNNMFRLVSPRDTHGHGDMATAFSLAMLAAAEFAAKGRVTLRDPTNTSDCSYANAVERFQQRQQRYAEEMEYFANHDDDGNMLDGVLRELGPLT